ncbi:MAG TPA: hypothetical protein VJB60_04755 [Candidatus Peribacterales bacterium]|nr:hypothetical protein [Candidatus Peribacterales bacterium]
MKLLSTQPEDYPETPITREKNQNTGQLWWADDGFQKVEVRDCGERLTQFPLTQEPLYDGVDEFGGRETRRVLGGGVKGKILLVRTSVARQFEQADEDLYRHFGGDYRYVGHDTFRHYRRQMSAYEGDFEAAKKRYKVEGELTTEQIYLIGKAASQICSWVPPHRDTQEYNLVVTELRRNREFISTIETIAQQAKLGQDPTPEEVSQILFEYIAISANAKTGLAKYAELTFNYENNPHAGASAVDGLLQKKRNGKWVPLAASPMDYVGVESALDYLENDKNFDSYRKRISGAEHDPLLRTWVTRMGFDPDNFSWQDWKILRGAKRIHYHLFNHLGATFYSGENPADGGEHWHSEHGPYYHDIRTGEQLYRRQGTEVFQYTGNPGHTFQKMGASGVAVYGGKCAHDRVEEEWGGIEE